MAYYLDYGKSSYSEHPKQPSLRLRLRNYEGPYDPATLSRARDELMYHVECTQNMAVWRRIRMKTPVNVNGIRDEDDGFGEASDMFSHAELPENKAYAEPYQDGRLNFDDNTDTKQTSTATVTEEDRNDVKTDKDNAADDRHMISKETGTITIDINDAVDRENSSVGEIDNSSDCIIIDDDENLTKNKEIEPENVSVCIIDDDDEDLKKNEETEIVHGNIKQADASADLEKHEIEKNKIEIEETSGSRNENENLALGEEDAEDCRIKVEKLSKNGEIVKSATWPKPMQGLKSIFKCDHCEERCSDDKSMHEHLVSAMHYSAGRYNVDDVGGVVLKKSAVIKNMEAKYKTIIMKCPVASCKNIFPQMDVCVKHYSKKHQKREMTENQFGLVDIVKDREYTVALKPPHCCHCSLSFKKISALNSHMVESHFPVTSTKCNARVFACNYCEKYFKLLEGLLSHQEVHENVANDKIFFRLFEYDNLRKFAVSSTGRISALSGSLAISGKRKHDQTYSETEPKVKVKKTSKEIRDCSQSCSVTVVIETNNEKNDGGGTDEKSMNNTGSHDAVKIAVNQVESLSAAVQSDADSEAEKVNNANTLQNSLKCDYCIEVNSSKEQMLSHLNETGHRSASPVLIDSDKKVHFLKDLSSILSVSNQRPKVYAACTEENCPCLFSTVYQSIEHHILCHTTSNETELKPCYGIAEDIDEVTLKLSARECIVCGESFNRLKKLSTHYNKEHYPFSPRDGCKLFFGCVYCPSFFLSFKPALTHIQIHRNGGENEMLDLSVLYVDCTSIKKIELPPKYSSNVDRWEGDIKSLQLRIQQLEESCEKVTEKRPKMKLEKTLRALKQKLVNIFC